MTSTQIIKSRDFTRRAVLIGGAKMVLLSALGARLYKLQLIDGGKYQTLSDDNRIRLLPVMPKRGRILDRYGNVLAEGKQRYQVLFTPDKNAEKIAYELGKILDFDFFAQQELLKKIAGDKKIILVADYLEWKDIAKLEVNSTSLSGVEIAIPEIRHYPYGEIAANLTGYTGVYSGSKSERSVLSSHPDFRTGKTGAEKSLNSVLKGKAGLRHVEVNSEGRFVRELDVDGSLAGKDINLTIDIELQKFVKEQLTGKGGLNIEGASAVVIDINSGDVLAMVSVPSYDPNKFVRGIKQDYWNELLHNKDLPLSNRCISMQYPPGSTFKTMVALAALEEGVITPASEIYCPGYYKIGKRKFHCWKRQGHGKLDLGNALAQSCNVYFYTLSLKLGVEKIAAMARTFGLGEKTGIELPNEKSGLIPTKAWKRKVKGKPWYKGETLNTAIGQGYMLATPLQLAVMTARLASLGTKIKPSIVMEDSIDQYELVTIDTGEKILLPRQKKNFDSLNLNPQHVKQVLKGMEMVVNDPHGTVYRNRIKESEYKFAGKTGTAQTRNKTFRFMPKKKIDRHHALFIGYAPVLKPRYAVSVVVEHGGYGSVMAAPIGKAILLEIQKMEKGG